jgi:hypothetical protein
MAIDEVGLLELGGSAGMARVRSEVGRCSYLAPQDTFRSRGPI